MKKFIYILLIGIVLFLFCDVVFAADPNLEFASGASTCTGLLGKNLTSLVRVLIKIVQIAAAVIAVVKGMLILVPAVSDKSGDGLNKALSTLAKLFVILAIIFVIPTIIKVLGSIFGFDISCFF